MALARRFGLPGTLEPKWLRLFKPRAILWQSPGAANHLNNSPEDSLRAAVDIRGFP